MFRAQDFRVAGRLLGAVAVVVSLASCAGDNPFEPAGAVEESAAAFLLAPSAPLLATLGGGVTVTQIAMESRRYFGGPQGTAAGAIAAFNASPTTFGGYTNALKSFDPMACCTANLFNATFPGGGSSTNIAFHFVVGVTATTASTVNFRFGIDFGLGGVLLVDGVQVDGRASDMWWAFSFANPDQFLKAGVTLSSGAHTLEMYGFEGCCDGPIRGELDIGAGWQLIQLGSYSFNLDVTPPTVTYSGNAGAYTVDQTVNITCNAADDTGVASTTCQNISGPAYTFALGTNTFSATATDFAGNVGTGSTSFTVSVTSGSLCNLVRQFVSNAGVANSMCQQLANGAYAAFRNHVRAQSGKSVSASNGALLISLSNSL